MSSIKIIGIYRGTCYSEALQLLMENLRTLKKTSEQGKEAPTTHIWCQVQDFNQGHVHWWKANALKWCYDQKNNYSFFFGFQNYVN